MKDLNKLSTYRHMLENGTNHTYRIGAAHFDRRLINILKKAGGTVPEGRHQLPEFKIKYSKPE